jgi:L-lysine 2,3-aminomutase
MIHPKEITMRTKDIVYDLLKARIRCFSQIPLLKGINIFEDVEKSRNLLKEFLEKIISARITQYYFIVKMALPGTAHLTLPLEKIQEIFRPFMQHGGEVPGTALTFKLMAAAPEQKVFIYPETKFHYDKGKKGYMIDIGEKEVFYPYEDPEFLSQT